MLRSARVSLFLTTRSLLRGHKGLTLTPILSMMIIYVNLLFIPSLIQGAIHSNRQQLVDAFSADYTIRPKVSDTDITDLSTKLAKIRTLPEVAAATSVLQVGNRITKQNQGNYWTVLAVDPISYAQVFHHKISLGSFLATSDKPEITLGARIAGNGYENQPSFDSTLGGEKIGDSVNVLLYNGGDTAFTVSGIFNDKFYDSDTRAYISRGAYQRLDPASSERATAVFVKLKSGSGDISSKLHAILGDAQIQNPDQTDGTFLEQVNTYRGINNIIGGMALFMASVIIFIVTYIDLTQRRRQIGIERAMGVRPGAILSFYLLRTTICTSLGIILGGVVFRFGIVTYFSHRPFVLPIGEVSLVSWPALFVRYGLLLLAMACIAALAPVVYALRIRILDAIWGID